MERFGFAEDEAIEHSMISKAIEAAQSKIEGINLDMRKHVLEYDDVLNKQRKAIYAKRNTILGIDTEEELDEYIKSLFTSEVVYDPKLIQEKKEKFGLDQFKDIIKQISLSAIDGL
jgi:preprotein translocase subunit SecA